MKQFKVLISKHTMLINIRNKEFSVYNDPCKNIPKLLIKCEKKIMGYLLQKIRLPKAQGVRCPTHQMGPNAKPVPES